MKQARETAKKHELDTDMQSGTSISGNLSLSLSLPRSPFLVFFFSSLLSLSLFPLFSLFSLPPAILLHGNDDELSGVKKAIEDRGKNVMTALSSVLSNIVSSSVDTAPEEVVEVVEEPKEAAAAAAATAATAATGAMDETGGSGASTGSSTGGGGDKIESNNSTGDDDGATGGVETAVKAEEEEMHQEEMDESAAAVQR